MGAADRRHVHPVIRPNELHQGTDGLAYDPVTGYLLISDDRSYKIHWVDPDNPTVKLGEFLTEPLGGSDPEDIAIDAITGHTWPQVRVASSETRAVIGDLQQEAIAPRVGRAEQEVGVDLGQQPLR